MVGPGMLAQILVSKYEYHQPLYRQEKMFRQQFGVDLGRKTMDCWVKQAAELLKPVYRSIREDLVRGSYLQADETPSVTRLRGAGRVRRNGAGAALWLGPAPG
jgi:transposase